MKDHPYLKQKELEYPYKMYSYFPKELPLFHTFFLFVWGHMLNCPLNLAEIF